ncbi:hypothetical protein [Pedobacter nototheniae]|uniref:hypothetical protein n=1 Tax=Pedobacter nototheniae TaxID=2488994 RepID=UPI001FE2962E|nr:hypothetical protein [Pedobacter nototheniae]
MFNFLKKKNAEIVPAITTQNEQINRFQTNIDIPEHIFIENETIPSTVNEQPEIKKLENNIELLFDFLDKNHEAKGYDDALMNPDMIHLEQNIEALKNQLERTIRRVKTFYEDFIKEIEFHIDSRARTGMVDVVDELKMKKNIAESHIQKVLNIEDEAKNNVGDSQGIIISYTRGFKNGLSAISHHTILKRF